MIRKLEIAELNQLYNEHIKQDFPVNERPPCFIIKKNLNNKLQEGFIYIYENEESGYAINSPVGELVLISLFAIFEEQRKKGRGTNFLRELIKYYDSKRTLIVEVEKPEKASTKEQRIVCEKRILFYESVGFVIYKDIDYKIFGVEMYIMIYSKTALAQEDVIEDVKSVYTQMLGRGFQKMLKIK